MINLYGICYEDKTKDIKLISKNKITINILKKMYCIKLSLIKLSLNKCNTIAIFVFSIFLIPILYQSAHSSYIPIDVGSYWIYEITSQVGSFNATSKAVMAITGEKDVMGKKCAVLTTEIGSTWSYSKNIIRTFFYDDRTGNITINGFLQENGGKVLQYEEYERGIIQYKYPFRVGASWTISRAKNINPSSIMLLNTRTNDIDSDGFDDFVDMTVSAKVVGVDDIKVPAGYFSQCFKIVYSYIIVIHCTFWGDIDMKVTDTIWFKPYIGMVKEEKVVDWPTPFDNMDQRMVYSLISYSVE